jgi:putative hydroxymethylpyrimidine transport system substrate-binding protein
MWQVVALAASVLALVAAGCGGSGQSSTGTAAQSGSTGSSAAPQELTLLLDWFPNPDHAALYLAKEKGYFDKAGLDMTFQAPSNAADPAKLVSTGKVPLGISYEPEVMISQAHGLKVQAVAALVPTALNSLIAPSKSGVTSVAGLQGKKLGSAGLASDTAMMKAITAKAGIPDSSVDMINVGSNLVSSMLSGSVDATIGGYRNVEAIQLKDRGANPWVMPVTDAGVPAYDELVIIANSDRLKTDSAYQDQVRKFLGALAQGNADAVANPTAAEDAIAPVAKGYSKDLLKKMVDATVPLLKNPKSFGYMDPAAWTSYGDWMYQQKLLPKKVDGKAAMTDAYLPKQSQ